MTLRFLRTTAAGLLGLAAVAAPQAQQNVDSQIITTAVPFLQIEPDSRAAGMGMTGVALADNAYALFWNPAGLAGQEGTEVSFTHAPWLPALGADLSFEYLSGKYGLGDAGTLGAHLTYFNLGEQIWTDIEGEEIGKFKSYELAAGLSYGKEVTENLSLGAGGRLIMSNLTGGQGVVGDAGSTETSTGVSFGFDLGAQYELPMGGEKVTPTLGFNLANVGPGISYTESGIPSAIPTNLKFGAAVETELDEFNKLNFALDLNKILVNRDTTGEYDSAVAAIFSSWRTRRIDTNPDPNEETIENVSALRQLTLGAGVEYWYNDLLALRSGYFYEDPQNGNRQFLTFGAGVRYSLAGFDMSYIYAVGEDSPVDRQLRFSLLLNVPR
ncbi:MAG: type IX secretion system outer membrane channel protein PorV [Rubricoccaceae bacterium]